MALWFLRGLRRGIVTTRYPRRPDPSAALLPTPPAFIPSRLTPALVDQLAAACPSRAITRDGDSLRLDVSACTACGRCQQLAPHAVTASGHFELATAARHRLIKRIPIEGH